MLGFFVWFLVAILLLDCLILVLLVLMQLPKKDAGAGLAFGGAATDALFGAGSGNFLTKATKYTAGIFFALAVLLSVLQPQYYRHDNDSRFRRGVEMQGKMAPPATTSPEAVPSTPAPAPTASPTNVPILRPLVTTNSPPN